jgi:hypothetical protein
MSAGSLMNICKRNYTGGPTASHPQLPHHPQRQQSRSIPEGDVRRRTSHQTGAEAPSSLTRLLRRRRRRSKCNATQPPPLSSPSPMRCFVLYRVGRRRLRRSFRCLCLLSVGSIVPLSDGDRALILAPSGLGGLMWGSKRP